MFNIENQINAYNVCEQRIQFMVKYTKQSFLSPTPRSSFSELSLINNFFFKFCCKDSFL